MGKLPGDSIFDIPNDIIEDHDAVIVISPQTLMAVYFILFNLVAFIHLSEFIVEDDESSEDGEYIWC